MTTITDDEMNALRSRARECSVVILRSGPNRHMDGATAIIWEHGRRNLSLRADGIMPVICPIVDDDVAGVCVLLLPPVEARAVMRDDPGVLAGIFVADVYAARTIPGVASPPSP